MPGQPAWGELICLFSSVLRIHRTVPYRKEDSPLWFVTPDFGLHKILGVIVTDCKKPRVLAATRKLGTNPCASLSRSSRLPGREREGPSPAPSHPSIRTPYSGVTFRAPCGPAVRDTPRRAGVCPGYPSRRGRRGNRVREISGSRRRPQWCSAFCPGP